MNLRSLVMLVLVLWDVANSAERASLRHLWYDGGTSTSTMTLDITGRPRATIHRAHGSIFIGLASTSIAPPLGEPTLQFAKGAIQSVSIRNAGPDSVTIEAAFRGGQDFEVQNSTKGNALLFAFSAADPASVSARRKKIVDISAIARTNETTPNRGPAPQMVGRASENQRHSSGTPLVYLAIGIVLLAAGGTLCVVAFILGRTSVKHPSMASAPRHFSTALAEEDDIRDSATPEVEATLEGPSTDDADDFWPGDQDQAISLARNMGRGTGEVDLAFRLQSSVKRMPRADEILLTCGEKPSGVQRMNAAKKLKVGRGEIDLALRLKEFQIRTTHDEEDQQ